MLRSLFKIALRNVKKHRGFSIINIVGLAIGIACSILIFLLARFELSYDTFHEKSDRICRVAIRALVGGTEIDQVSISAVTFQKILEDFPEVETGVKFLRFGKQPVSGNEKAFYESRFYAVDSTFFDVFTVPLIHGSPDRVLIEPNSMVVTEATALKYFGRTDVIGEVLRVGLTSDPESAAYRITGVSESLPANSHFHYDILASLTSFPDKINYTGWSRNIFTSYVVLNEGVVWADLEERLKVLDKKYGGADEAAYDAWLASGNYWEYYLQPLTSIHLESDLYGKSYVYMLLVIGIVVLLIACVNFMNLSTARASLRAREVGIRKVIGSDRKRLVGQFLGESVLLSLIALAVAMLIVELVLPPLRILLGRPIDIGLFDSPVAIPTLLAFAVVIGIISGSYPAFILSAFRPVAVLKSGTSGSKGGLWIRNGLIMFQFSVSIFLIIGTLTIYQQLKYVQDRELGFDKEEVLVINNPGTLVENIGPFKEALKIRADIQSVSGSNTLPGGGLLNIGFQAEGVDESFTLNLFVVDYGFTETLKMEMLQGRFFSRDFGTDSSAIVLNQKACDLLGWDDPIGKQLQDSYYAWTVIGVVEDSHYESLHQEIRPMALALSGGRLKWTERNILVRLNTEHVARTIGSIEDIWGEFASDMPCEYSFLDDNLDSLYANDKQTQGFFAAFSAVAILIACIGLFGLASFVIEQKAKEIVIRRVMGASASGIVGRLSIDFVKWVILSNLVAWPMAWLVMERWLQNFAYRIDIGTWSFLSAGILAIVVALITVAFQVIKAAVSNPVDALRYE